MQDIPFGKFFDAQEDHDLISSFELLKSQEINYPGDDMAYLLKSNLTDDYYVVIGADHGTDWDQVDDWTRKVVQNTSAKLEEILPKHPETYADSYYLFRVVI